MAVLSPPNLLSQWSVDRSQYHVVRDHGALDLGAKIQRVFEQVKEAGYGCPCGCGSASDRETAYIQES
jgi:hypothetical protein